MTNEWDSTDHGRAARGDGHELSDFMAMVADDLAKHYARITRRSKDDPGTAGDDAEHLWKEILEGYLPPSLQVVTKGRILGANGQPSPQVDVIILRSSYPRRLRNMKYYLAAGVVAAFECKLTLRKRDLRKIGSTSRAIREIAHPGPKNVYGDLHSSIMFGVLALSSEWSFASDPSLSNYSLERDVLREDRTTLDNALSSMLQENSHPSETLDALCVADLACWERRTFVTPPRHYFTPEAWEQVHRHADTPENGHVWNALVRPARFESYRDNPIGNPLFAFLAMTLRRLGWSNPDCRELAEYWSSLDPQMERLACAQRDWPLEVFSEHVLEQIQRGALEQGNCWCGWASEYD